MTESSNPADRELRDRFVRERQREAPWTPSFERVLAARPVRRPAAPRWAVLGLAAALVVTIVAVTVSRRTRSPSDAAMRLVAVRLGEWRTPTDFLLDVPGTNFLREVPDFGRPEEWLSLPKSRSSRL